MKKVLITLVFSLMLMTLLVSCKEQMMNDINTDGLATDLMRHVEDNGFFEDLSPEYVEGTLGITPDEYDECVGKRATCYKCDEFGVFKCSDIESAKALEAKLSKALDKKRDEWDGRYYTADNEKVAGARAKRYGQYVIYTVLGDDVQGTVEDSFNKLLKG